MKLKYSLHYRDWEHLWIDGARPFPKRPNKKIMVHFLSGNAPANFPHTVNYIGDLLTTERTDPQQSFYATLLLSYPINQATRGDIRIALPLELINRIRTVDNKDFAYELSLDKVDFTDVTPGANLHREAQR
jgi:hypothetical protein